MNRKISNGLIILMMGILLISPARAYADTFKGEITKAGDDKQSFTLLYDSKSKKEMQFWVTPETKFTGLSSLSEVVNGDEVAVKAQHNKANSRWEADSVELTKVMIRNPVSEAPVTQAITEESKNRAAEEQAEKPALDLAETEKRLAAMEKQINDLQKKAANSSSLKEKTDMLLADLNKKRMLLKAKIEELKNASPGQVEELTKSVLQQVNELDQALIAASQEIAADKVAVV